MIMILKMITLGTGAKHRSTCAFIALFYLYVVVVVCWLYLIMRDSLLSFFFFWKMYVVPLHANLYGMVPKEFAVVLRHCFHYGIASAD
jgi:hypothetical protein